METQIKLRHPLQFATATVTGGFKGGERTAVDPDFRMISLEEISQGASPSAELWVVMHGWNCSLDNFRQLATAIAKAKPRDRVLLLDWQQISLNGSFWNGGNYRVASWIIPVAEKIEYMLRRHWQVSDEDAHQKLHLVGHSLGSILSAELAARFNQGAKIIFALDPASEWHLRPFKGRKGYALDGRTSVRERPREFHTVARHSIAFVGRHSAAGNQKLAASAHQSFQLDFGSLSISQHVWVHEIFRRFIVPEISLTECCFNLCYPEIKLSLVKRKAYRFPRRVTCSLRQTRSI
ncbi:MAG: hypothetical protein AAFR15_06230 [Cyanobacteria bacterium J06627_15]